jgi:membrane protein DedA with SNARE-associated domain
MLEDIILYMGSVGPGWIYLILFFFAFIENVFPPSPSDVVVVVGAALIATTSVDYVPVLFVTSIGSALGFILMYYVGKLFGDKVVRSGKLKFLSEEDISKTDIWFTRYGYKLILANRFLPGTRSVISFFAGTYELELGKTFFLAAISAFVWNAIIIYMGMVFGNNVEKIDYYLSTYATIIIIITVIVVVIFAGRYIYKRLKA